jgi:hypothetical protein
MKLPLLVQHFYEHQKENPKLNLVAFLNLHYAQGEVFDADHEKDMKLPFKSHHTHCNCSLIVFCAPIQNYSFIYNTFYNEFPKPLFGYSFAFISNYHSTIWQPPKNC